MPDPHDPLPPRDKKHRDVPPPLPDSDLPQRDWPEGQIPGLPVSRDPLREPGPTPAERDIPPLD